MSNDDPCAEGGRLTLEADLTIYNAIDAKHQLLDAVHSLKTLELDLSQVGEMDTAGFQLLVLAKRESQKLGRTLRIVAHSPAVLEVLEFYNMVAFFGDPVVIPAAARQ
ncbi:MAG: anti-sigma B factor antagonist [Rhodocyclales bacterium GWA2_65_20]|nr:MAG: anti-sigma B factor antagonist [Rhodocyclales bacterium GWA2_65_20]